MFFSRHTLIASVLASIGAAGRVTLETDDVDIYHGISQDVRSAFVSGWDEAGMDLRGVYFHYPGPDYGSSNGTTTEISMPGSRFISARQLVCNGGNCVNYSPNSYLFTQEEQEFIAGKFCNFVGHAFAGGAVPLGVTTVAQGTCTLAGQSSKCELLASFSLGIAFSYAAAFNAVKQECDRAIAFVEAKCGPEGGSANCVKTNGQKEATYHLRANAPTTFVCPKGYRCEQVSES